MSADGEPRTREIVEIDWDAETAEKQGYETFMLKEINEQADAVAETIGERAAREDGIDLGDLGAIDDDLLRSIRRVVIVACGTSYHAGLIGRYAIEEWARVPVEVEVASEYRYRNPVVGPEDLVIGITQSGETADTLAAMRDRARPRRRRARGLTNIMGSQATREADGVLYTRAGLEIGVAATKTFVSQVTSCTSCAAAGRAARRSGPRRAGGQNRRAETDPAPDRARFWQPIREISSGSRRPPTRPTSFCISDGTWACRSRSRARSSSRRSPTSPPTPTRPGR